MDHGNRDGGGFGNGIECRLNSKRKGTKMSKQIAFGPKGYNNVGPIGENVREITPVWECPDFVEIAG